MRNEDLNYKGEKLTDFSPVFIWTLSAVVSVFCITMFLRSDFIFRFIMDVFGN